jgi:hypothetical protein
MKPTGHLLAFCDGDSYPVFYPTPTAASTPSTPSSGTRAASAWAPPSGSSTNSSSPPAGQAPTAATNAASPTSSAFHTVPSADRLHPVEKPVTLLATLLKPVLPPGGVVLDPFAGGGSTLIAARNAGARAIGIDTEERYLDVIAA